MKSRISLAVGLFLMVLAWPVAAQDAPDTISRSYTSRVKAGHELQFEEALKQHMAWHTQQNDTWRWNTYMLVSGERLGQYISISGGHRWADFDSPAVSEEADNADALAKLGEHVERISSGFANGLAAVSRPPSSSEPSPLVQVLTYRLNQGHGARFRDVLRRFDDAAEETNWSGRYSWLEILSGGAEGTYILVLPHANWASLAPSRQSPPGTAVPGANPASAR